MKALFKIAFRSIVMNKKRSLLIGFAIFISAFLLNISNALMNGIDKQVLRGYKNLQSGDIAVIWSGLKKIKNNDASRLMLASGKEISFNLLNDEQNKKSIDELEKFVKENEQDIKSCYPVVKRVAQLYANEKVGMLVITGLTEAHAKHILDTGALSMKEGVLYTSEKGICISEENAGINKLKLGDIMRIEAMCLDGSSNTVEFKVEGIYRNGAGYDNYYGFMPDKAARQVFGYDDKYFDIANIFLNEGKNDVENIELLAEKLDKELQTAGNVLRAESYPEASAFYTNNPKNYKIMFNGFIIFLLLIIAIGLRATIRMNLFQRMSEFGTLRAVGFSRLQCYTIIFNEVFILSLISLAVSIAISSAVILMLADTGIYAGAGAMSYAFGGESLYPVFRWVDMLFAVGVMIMLALVSTLNPGLRLCWQQITDILAKRQKRVYPMQIMIKGLFARKPGDRKISAEA